MPPTSSSSPFIRPVTRSLPASSAIWEDTNLPLAVVLTPLKLTNTTKNVTNKPVACIPKCLHCGAPHPSKATHYRPNHLSVLICYLCGKSSPTRIEAQQEARAEEHLDIHTYDTVISDASSTEFQLPLYSSLTSNNEPISWKLPAMACPPVWWIVLDGSCSNGSYWHSVGNVISNALEGIPPHVHIGIVAASSTTLSSWDLASQIPHVLHSSQMSPASVDSLCLVPCDALHLSRIRSALRAVVDSYGGTGGGNGVTTENKGTGMALGSSLETILEFMEQAVHPGARVRYQNNLTASSESQLKYAGGKVLCLLSGPPVEIESHQRHSLQPYHMGGIGGSCAPTIDKWQGCSNEPPPEVEPTDMTPSNLIDYMSPLHVNIGEEETLQLGDGYYQLLGAKFGQAGLGVDVVVVSPQDGNTNTTWFGLPFLRGLSDRSGAPGPVIVSTNPDQSETLQHQIKVRTPWQSGVVFGGELRLRISPGFQVDANPVEPIDDKKYDNLHLAPFTTSGGIMGPATAEEAESQLWVLGTCDPYTSVTVDLEVIDADIRNTCNVDEFGDVVLKNVIQTCFAYTILEEDENGEVYVVRKLQVSCMSLQLAREAEALFDALDPEALAVVLFQKLLLSSLQDGIVETQQIGKNWLKSILVCVYLSAEVQHDKRTNRLLDEAGLDDGVAIPGCSPSFISSARLLDEEGQQFSAEDILLGQGHEQIQILPFLAYALLQCDGLRPTNGSFRPSMDGRCAALAQMSSMTPSVLAKCIAPCLQLWSTREDTQIIPMVDLNRDVIVSSLQEATEGDVFFLDSPQCIMLWKAKTGTGNSDTPEGEQEIKIGPNLKAAIDSASAAYRTAPAIQYKFGENDYERADRILDDVLIEDKPTANGLANFIEWRSEIARMVQE